MRGNMTNGSLTVRFQKVLFLFTEQRFKQWLEQQSLEWRRGIALRSSYVIIRHRYPNLAKSGFTLNLLRRKASADLKTFLQDGQLPDVEKLMDVWLNATSLSKRRELRDPDEMRLIVNDFIHVLGGELAFYDD